MLVLTKRDGIKQIGKIELFTPEHKIVQKISLITINRFIESVRVNTIRIISTRDTG